jgi:hypothetical protein
MSERAITNFAFQPRTSTRQAHVHACYLRANTAGAQPFKFIHYDTALTLTADGRARLPSSASARVLAALPNAPTWESLDGLRSADERVPQCELRWCSTAAASGNRASMHVPCPSEL